MKPIQDLRVADVVTVDCGSQPFDRDVDEANNRTFGKIHERSTAEIAEAHNHKPLRSLSS